MKQRKQINVAHIFLTLEVGGMEKVGLDLIRGLSDNFKSYIICLDSLGVFGEELQKNGYPVFSLNKGKGYKLRVIRDLIRIFRREQIDIVHTNNPAPHFWGGLAALMAGVKIRIHTKHGRNFLYLKRRVLLNRLSALLSTRIVCVSGDAARLTHEVEKVPLKKINVIHNGINADEFKPTRKQKGIIEELGIKKDQKIIGSIARFNVDKDQKTLVQSFSKLQKAHPNVLLVLIGDGETFKKIKKLVAKNNMKKRILLLGYRSDINDLLSIMDLYVLSSHTEGLSISLLEAMAMELPCIATNVGGNSEIITDGINGFLVQENNVGELTERMDELLRNRQLGVSLGKTARDTVLTNFSISSMIIDYEQLYLSTYKQIFKDEIIVN